MKRVALYNPYLETLGGGEKHILSILKVLEDEGCEINIFWDKNLQDQIEERFNLEFTSRLSFLPNIFKISGSNNPQGLLNKIITLKGFDLFFYITDGSYFFSSAKKNFLFCMVPDKKLYTRSLINKLKTSNFRFIANSLFTQRFLTKWGIKSVAIYPFVEQALLNKESKKKEKIILSVGRFYGHLHSKKQSILINLFKKLKQSNKMYKDFKLILAGGLKKEDKPYFNDLEKTISNNKDIELKTNLKYSEMQSLYNKSSIYIHAAGYGVDENKNPEQVEHLGITPLEAMASGCLTFCYNAGGPKEIVESGKNGFLFNDESELIKQLTSVLSNRSLQTEIKKNAKQYVMDKFSYEKFKSQVKETIL